MAAQRYSEIPGSQRPAPVDASRIDAVHPDERIEVSIYLKSGDDDVLLALPPVSEAEAAHHPAAAHGSRDDTAQARSDALAENIDKVVRFATSSGLSVVKTDPARRLVKVAGTADKLEAAFRTKLSQYHDGQHAFRGRSGSLSAPEEVVDVIDAVLGLDTRRQSAPRLRRTLSSHLVTGHAPNEVAALYGFPKTPGQGKGQCIAIIELGGGYRDSDNQAAFAAMGLPVPKVSAISVSGGLNKPGPDPNSDGEVALDIQVAGAAAPGAAIAVYFAPNTTQGFVDAITRAVHDQQNRPSVISISWGAPESGWTKQAITAMNAALRDAAQLGVTVFAASGDNLATDGVGDGRGHVDFPASSPYAVGCGGTLIDVKSGKIAREVVWNEGTSGTGGGISDVFAVPGYQAKTALPKSVNGGRVGRGVPDISGDADPRSGYRIVVGGATGLIGGTSAVAPLWAGLAALLNEACGHPIGFIHPVLYGNPAALQNISTGNNKDGGLGYAAGAGWDACTGLGVPNGAALLKLFKAVASGQREKPVKKKTAA